MPLEQQIVEDLKEAMRAKDELRTSCLRMVKTAIKNKQVEKGDSLDDQEIQSVISSLVKKGKQSIQEFRKGGREDLAAKEEKELNILYRYLPEQLDRGEIEKVLRDIIAELSITSPKDLGKVMKVAMSRMAGKAQGKEVNEIAKRILEKAPV
ncbi:MAG: GatB/YqeY domain-containing protein [Deltaproteobacteria bacterium]|nr:GatB/YqeY domain-containing protein [Deltaproteobacteria bacterium]MBW2138120.1 GatB/YqeY domain-containing protein [Deltaproteobacteria bacterium]